MVDHSPAAAKDMPAVRTALADHGADEGEGEVSPVRVATTLSPQWSVYGQALRDEEAAIAAALAVACEEAARLCGLPSDGCRAIPRSVWAAAMAAGGRDGLLSARA